MTEEPTTTVVATTDLEWRYMWGAKVKTPIDAPDDLVRFSIDTARKHLGEIEVADWQSKGDDAVLKMKKEFDEKWGQYWHIIVGRSFGSFVTHESKRFLFFYIGDYAVLVYKAG